MLGLAPTNAPTRNLAAFTEDERRRFALIGPLQPSTPERQVERVLVHLEAKPTEHLSGDRLEP